MEKSSKQRKDSRGRAVAKTKEFLVNRKSDLSPDITTIGQSPRIVLGVINGVEILRSTAKDIEDLLNSYWSSKKVVKKRKKITTNNNNNSKRKIVSRSTVLTRLIKMTQKRRQVKSKDSSSSSLAKNLGGQAKVQMRSTRQSQKLKLGCTEAAAPTTKRRTRSKLFNFLDGKCCSHVVKYYKELTKKGLTNEENLQLYPGDKYIKVPWCVRDFWAREEMRRRQDSSFTSSSLLTTSE